MFIYFTYTLNRIGTLSSAPLQNKTREKKAARKRAVKSTSRIKKMPTLTQASLTTQVTEWENQGEGSPEAKLKRLFKAKKTIHKLIGAPLPFSSLGQESGLKDMNTQFNTAGNSQLPFSPRPLFHFSPINMKPKPTISFIQKIVTQENCLFIGDKNGRGSLEENYQMEREPPIFTNSQDTASFEWIQRIWPGFVLELSIPVIAEAELLLRTNTSKIDEVEGKIQASGGYASDKAMVVVRERIDDAETQRTGS
ncbi:uncharacterized protein Bfra_010000 [Botrytis fragariae]|uniref:Uncharacterized protein n=1 Tax=Botrytis fragariae TaxID=1964551 RepID=A0A8H6AN06_9HELO|nr:uncharacterized protein Bfra_010000 [Botrytis fragariae]KAF5870611.1 hypothetical protein Bfra_010000 [Botrytis fragariae]